MSSSIPERGDLAHHLLPRLMLELHESRFTGELTLEQPRASKIVAWSEGAPVAVESTLRSESLSSTLQRSKHIDSEGAEQIREEVKRRHCQEAAAVLGLQLLEPKVLFRAMKERMAQCLVEAIAWPEGRFALDANRAPGDDTRAFRIDALALVQRGLVAHWSADRLCAGLLEHRALVPRATEAGIERLRRLGGDEQAVLRALALLDGKRSLEAVIGAVFASPHALAALWMADVCGWLSYEASPSPGDESTDEATTEIEIEVSGSTRRAVGAAGRAWAAREQTAQDAAKAEQVAKEVLELHGALDGLDHYEFLGVDRKAKPTAIKKAYFQAAKRYHPDKLARLGLDHIRQAAAEVFARFAEAHEVLGDERRRSEYDLARAGGGDVDEVDVARLTQAETFFRKGEILAKMGDFRAAADLFKSTVDLWPDECAYQSHLGWALFKRMPPDPDGALSALETAVALDPEDARAHRWLGLVLRDRGDEKRAAELLARARILDPNVS